MRYENRLQRLEQHALPLSKPLRIVRYLVDPRDGLVEAFDKQTDTCFKREYSESEADFRARVTQAVQAMESVAVAMTTSPQHADARVARTEHECRKLARPSREGQ